MYDQNSVEETTKFVSKIKIADVQNKKRKQLDTRMPRWGLLRSIHSQKTTDVQTYMGDIVYIFSYIYVYIRFTCWTNAGLNPRHSLHGRVVSPTLAPKSGLQQFVCVCVPVVAWYLLFAWSVWRFPGTGDCILAPEHVYLVLFCLFASRLTDWRTDQRPKQKERNPQTVARSQRQAPLGEFCLFPHHVYTMC